MKQFAQEFTIALMVCWLVAAALSGCAVDQRQVYDMITKQKPVTEQPWTMRAPARVKGN